MTSGDDRESSDTSLLRRFRAGEQDAATRLYLRYARRLQGLAAKQSGSELQSRFDPEDIVQSVFRTFFRRAREGHYDVPDGEELWRLFLVIALHKVRDAAAFHRAARRAVARTVEMPSTETIGRMAADQQAERTLQMVIEDIMQELPEIQRDIVRLRIDGETVDQISRITARSRRTVERTLQSFRERLREHDCTDEDPARRPRDARADNNNPEKHGPEQRG